MVSSKSKNLMRCLIALLFMGILDACASQGQQGQGDDNLNSQQGNGNGEENFKGENGAEKEDPATAPNEGGGAEVNSATEDDGNGNSTLNGGLAGSDMPAAGNSDPLATNPTGTGGMANSSTPPPGNTPAAAPESPGAAPAPAPTPSSDQAPVAGGRVRYVKEGGVQVMNAPGGTPVFTLEQGDHPVTWEENGWLKLSTGMYVPVSALSDQGVGRPAPGNSWR